MKRPILAIIPSVIIAFTIMAFAYPTGRTADNKINPPQENLLPDFPEGILHIMEASCFDCHSSTSSNQKALDKVDFSKWSELSKGQQLGKLEKIKEEVSKGEMPPKKFVEHFPDRVPTQEQRDSIIKWVDETTDKMMGQ